MRRRGLGRGPPKRAEQVVAWGTLGRDQDPNGSAVEEFGIRRDAEQVVPIVTYDVLRSRNHLLFLKFAEKRWIGRPKWSYGFRDRRRCVVLTRDIEVVLTEVKKRATEMSSNSIGFWIGISRRAVESVIKPRGLSRRRSWARRTVPGSRGLCCEMNTR